MSEDQTQRSEGEQRLYTALLEFDRALTRIAPALSDEDRKAFTDAIWRLIEAVLDRVTIISYRMDRVREEAGKKAE